MPSFSLPHLILLGTLLSSVHWLIARSKIMQPLWSRATGRWAALLECPACSGFWLGILCLPVNGAPWCHWQTHIVQGILGIWLTPVFEALLLWGLSLTAFEKE